jgi:outer membrane murein-binding lipoprotein Lpp
MDTAAAAAAALNNLSLDLLSDQVEALRNDCFQSDRWNQQQNGLLQAQIDQLHSERIQAQGLQAQVDQLHSERTQAQGLQAQVDQLHTEQTQAQGLQAQVDQLRSEIRSLQQS